MHYMPGSLEWPRPSWPQVTMPCGTVLPPGYSTRELPEVTCKRCLKWVKADAVRRLQGTAVLEVEL